MKDSARRERTPPVGAIGYTGSYREPCADIADVSVVSVLEARGPEEISAGEDRTTPRPLSALGSAARVGTLVRPKPKSRPGPRPLP